ncbi:hypothetical protein SD51_04345 [Alicyclobacillus tengchongensis]|nr:hypothetical protein SD51_04345 [Alicyclobacillus tengchongensis]
MRKAKAHARAWMWIAAVALVSRLLVIFTYGPHMSLHSDDAGYYRSAVWFLQSGTLSYYTPEKPTLHMMPGITFLLAAIIALFGQGALGLYVGKIVFALIGTAGVVGIYKTVGKITSPAFAAIVALAIALYPPSVEIDTLFLTEPLFTATFAWAFYYLLKLEETKALRDLVWLSIFFMLAMYVRPNVALWAVIGILYLAAKRYPRRLLVRHAGIAAAIGIAFMLPWWVRNELVFHKFVLLTDDSWNPLLPGTFQGQGYPPPANEGAVEHQLLREHPNLRPQRLHELPWFALEKQVAIQRIREWLKTNPQSFWHTYLWVKPQILWLRAYLPIPIFGMKGVQLFSLQRWLVYVSIIGHVVAMLFAKGRRLQLLLVWVSLLYFTLLFCVFFAFERYNVPIEWLMLMGAPAGLWAFVRWLLRPMAKHKRRRRPAAGRA